MSKQYTYQDTQRPDGCYVAFERVEERDDNAGNPAENDDGFWPSTDPQAAGYIGPNGNFAEQQAAAKLRWRSWCVGDWYYIGIRAVAHIFTVKNGTGKRSTLESAGLWAIESDSGPEYLDEVYQAEVRALKDEIAALQNPIYED